MAKGHRDVVPISELSPATIEFNSVLHEEEKTTTLYARVSVNDGSILPSITVDGNLGSLRVLSDSSAARPWAGAVPEPVNKDGARNSAFLKRARVEVKYGTCIVEGGLGVRDGVGNRVRCGCRSDLGDGESDKRENRELHSGALSIGSKRERTCLY